MVCASSMLSFKKGRSLARWAGIFPTASMNLTYVSASDSYRYSFRVSSDTFIAGIVHTLILLYFFSCL